MCLRDILSLHLLNLIVELSCILCVIVFDVGLVSSLEKLSHGWLFASLLEFLTKCVLAVRLKTVEELDPLVLLQ